MTIGRANNGAERRSRVSWNVERVPKNLMNCLGRPSRDAGQSRVPAPPHMTKGRIRLLGGDKLLISDKLAIVRNSSENKSQSFFSAIGTARWCGTFIFPNMLAEKPFSI